MNLALKDKALPIRSLVFLFQKTQFCLLKHYSTLSNTWNIKLFFLNKQIHRGYQKPTSKLVCHFKIGPSWPPFKMRTNADLTHKNWEHLSQFTKLIDVLYDSELQGSGAQLLSNLPKWPAQWCDAVICATSKCNLINTQKLYLARHTYIYVFQKWQQLKQWLEWVFCQWYRERVQFSQKQNLSEDFKMFQMPLIYTNWKKRR